MDKTFVTAINCMDGRVQEPVIRYMKERFNADYVDMITEPSPVAIITSPMRDQRMASIRTRLDISVHHHGSRVVAIVAHHDCAGNAVPSTRQMEQVRESIKAVKLLHPEVEAFALWVDENWEVSEVVKDEG